VSAFIASAKFTDAPPQPQYAVPSSLVRHAVETQRCTNTPQGHRCADLITLAFFFLLRVGEYTPTQKGRKTVPLRLQDIQLWHRNQRLDPAGPQADMQVADAITICLERQKNGRKGDTLHLHSSLDRDFDPVRAGINILSSLRTLPQHTPISVFLAPDGHRAHVTANIVRHVLRSAATAMNLQALGYTTHRIGSHSLRAGGAMHLKLLGYDEITIKKLGRWSSNTYLVYIQTQIADLTAGIATRMAEPLTFHIVANPSPSRRLTHTRDNPKSPTHTQYEPNT
jgi:hypothetical protein